MPTRAGPPGGVRLHEGQGSMRVHSSEIAAGALHPGLSGYRVFGRRQRQVLVCAIAVPLRASLTAGGSSNVSAVA